MEVKMQLNYEDANKIVQRTIKVLGRNINIMDRKGKIIASGNPAQIGGTHEGSLIAMQRGEPVEIYKEDVWRLKGVQPGVNIPIKLEDSIVGAVEISGDPSEVKQFGGMVKEIVELMLHEAYMVNKLQNDSKVREIYIQELINSRNPEKFKELVDRGNMLGINIQVPRICMLMDTYYLPETVTYLIKGKYSDFEDERQLLQGLKDRIIGFIKEYEGFGNNDIIQHIGGDRFVILKEVQSDLPEAEIKARAIEFCENLGKELSSEFLLKILWGIGRLYRGSDALYNSYRDSLAAINISAKYEHVGRIVHIDDVTVENIVSSIPSEQMELLLKSFHPLANLPGRMRNELMETLEAFFESSMNITDTAKKLGVHRNSVIYRLSKIKEVTGLDPSYFRDLVQLYLAFLSRQH
jgi:carbohydrate diacid regulator